MIWDISGSEKVKLIIDQAVKTWLLPDYLINAIHYVYGIGTPEENGYKADDYNDEGGWGEPYLDVISGMVYEAKRVKDLPLTYGWVEKEQLKSVQEVINGIDPTKYTRLEGNNCVVFYNDIDVVIHVSATGLNLTGGNITPTNNKVATLPSNITVNFIQFTNSVEVMDSSWVPTGNTMVMMIQNSGIFGRCRANATNGVIVQSVTIPRYLVSIT